MPTPNQPSKKPPTKSVIRTQSLDAVELLTADHANVKSLFEEYESLGDRALVAKKRLATEICLELTKHATAEEELFYPSVRSASKDTEDLVDEATVEHATAKDLIAQILAMDASEELFDAKVKVLAEYIQHHVKEEEGEIFPKARKLKLDLMSLGEAIQARKDEVELPPIQ